MVTTIPTPDVFTVGATAVQVSDRVEEGELLEIQFTNTSTGGQIIYLTDGQPAVAGQGIVLYPTGGHSEAADPAYNPSNLAWSAIASAPGATLAVRRRLRS